MESNKYYKLIPLLLFFFLFGTFYNFFKYDYLVPPGDDSLRHMTIAYKINRTGYVEKATQKGTTESGLVDIPVFHILLSTISQVTGVSIVETTQYFIRFLLAFIVLSLYFIAKRFFEAKIAFFAFLFLIFFSSTIGTIFVEGTYLDLYSASFLLPWGLVFLGLGFSRFRYFILSLFFLLGVILSHPLTTIGLFFILAILHFALLFFKKKINFWRRIFILDGLIILGLLIAWPFYFRDLLIKLSALLKFIFIFHFNVEQTKQSLNYLPTSLGSVPNFETYILYFGFISLIFGLLGFFFFLGKKIDLAKKVVLFSWIFGLFIASRLSVTQLPIRFARDIYLPLSIFVGIFFVWFWEKTKELSIFHNITKIIFIFILIFNLKNGLNASHNYIDYVRLQEPDGRAISWIEKNTSENDLFLGTPGVASGWGSFVTLLSDRKVIDCSVVKDCQQIFDPLDKEAREFYLANEIDYIYGGKPFIGPYLWKRYTRWEHYTFLSKASYLEKVFDYRDGSGRVVIYKVNKDKLKNYEQG